MNLLPVMVRELRAQSRQPMTYWLRVIGISAIIVVMALVDLRGAPSVLGGRLFGAPERGKRTRFTCVNQEPVDAGKLHQPGGTSHFQSFLMKPGRSGIRIVRIQIRLAKETLGLPCGCFSSLVEYPPCLTSGRFAPYRIGMQSNPLTTLSVKKLKHAVAIRAQIETLQNQLDRIAGAQAAPAKNGASGKKKRRLSVAARAKISAAARARWAKAKGKMKASGLPAARTKTRTSGAPLKTRIIHSLRSAGKSGVAVKELAAKLGKSYGNISVWFHTTAKGVNEIKKVAPGRFAWMP